MKKIISMCFMLIIGMKMMAQGWPANYKGVMLQGFYWDSWDQTNWRSLTDRADELSRYFDLIWIPNSAMTSGFYHNRSSKSNGYDPCFWLDHNTCYGTEAELRQMIQTYKQKGTGIIEDVVINHKNGLSDWATFPDESINGTRYGKTYELKWDNQNYSGICRNDEANFHPDSNVKDRLTGNNDTGDNFDGYRDLDHTNPLVQKNIETYVDYLINELGYAGFRYDMVKGFGAGYIKQYNAKAQPTFSVGEYWDNYEGVKGWIEGTNYASAAFDFPLHTVLKNTFDNGNWDALAAKGLAGTPELTRYSVTFVDNHDTYRETHHKVNHNVLAANALILALPGTPCIFYPHWEQHKEALKAMIDARKEAGVHNQSQIVRSESKPGGYLVEVKGDKHNLLVLSGMPQGVDTNGFRAVSVGDATNGNYAFYISTQPKTQATIYARCEDPNMPLNLYAWDASGQLNGAWPGIRMTNTCTIEGVTYYYTTLSTTQPTYNIIFNNGSGQQTDDITNRQGDGVYNVRYGGGRGLTIDDLTHQTDLSKKDDPYTINPTDKYYAFFEAPAAWTDVKAWAWKGNDNYTGGVWPGQSCQRVGTSTDGNPVWKWTYTGTMDEMPERIIFNSGSQQTNDFLFRNGGIYRIDGFKAQVADPNTLQKHVYDRVFTTDYRATVCLPMALTESELQNIQGTFYEYTSEQNGILHFDPVTHTEAYKPYLFIAAQDGKVLAPIGNLNKRVEAGRPMTITHGNFSFTGTVAQENLISNTEQTFYGYKQSDGTFVKVGNTRGAIITPYRGYFATAAQNTAAPLRIALGNTTAIDPIATNPASTGDIYTIDGKKVKRGATQQKGIYIINGKKIIK